MRTPFSRPVISIVFYAIGALLFLAYLLFGIGMMAGSGAPTSKAEAALSGLFALSGLASIAIGAVGGIGFVAIGYVIELIAKIEWNTRPRTDEMGYAIEPAASPSTTAMADKQYYVSDKGRLTGPLNAHEVLALYRDGRISISAQVSVEENGHRRLLKNLSELGL